MSEAGLVLLPGILSDQHFWHHQVAEFSSSFSIVIGELTAPSIEAMAQEVLSAAPARFALAGLSLGGYVAFEIWRRAPHRISRLALMDTHARSEPPEAIGRRLEMIEMARSNRFDEIMPSLMPKLIHPSLLTSPLADELIAMARRSGAQAFIRQVTAMLGRVDSRPMLPDIDVPTVVLCGEADHITPLPLAEEIAAGIPGAKLSVIKGAGHLPPIEQPEAVNSVLREWLAPETARG